MEHGIYLYRKTGEWKDKFLTEELFKFTEIVVLAEALGAPEVVARVFKTAVELELALPADQRPQPGQGEFTCVVQLKGKCYELRK